MNTSPATTAPVALKAGGASRKQAIVLAVVLALLVALPPVLAAFGLDFYIGVVRRILVFALAAASLNLILGYGGMVALGHAGFIGVGAYTVVALSDAGVASAWILWPAAALVAGLVAAGIGAVSLRTKGVYFIMITLAFAQMLYYVFVSLRSYGGDDGYTIAARPVLGFGLDSASESQLYWVMLALVALVLWAFNRAMQSRFGHALAGIRDNEIRMRALGYPVYRLQITAFVMAGAAAGLAGALLAANTGFVSPASMHWTQSATLVVMVVIGGMGRRWGGPVGAAIWLALEEILKLQTDYWHLPLGVLLIVIALWAPQGISALLSFAKKTQSKGGAA
jgi:branched-chain amino acid transport system permease protein